jgi:hypothetical protein
MWQVDTCLYLQETVVCADEVVGVMAARGARYDPFDVAADNNSGVRLGKEAEMMV